MRHLKSLVFVVYAHGFDNAKKVSTQETVKKPANAAKELSPEQLLKALHAALHARDAAVRIRQPVRDNPNTAKQVHQ